MATIIIPLDDAIANAKERYRDAERIYDDPPAEDIHDKEAQRRELLAPLFALDREIRTLEHVRDEKQAASVIVDAPSAEEVKAIEDALKALDQAISRTEAFQAILALVGAAAAAATTISTASRGGTPAPSAEVAAFAARIARAPAARTSAAPRDATPRYLCWESHREDITDLVRQALDDGTGVVALASRRPVSPGRSIVVSCSVGHVNVFDVPR